MTTTPPFTICVYCGSRPGHKPDYLTAAQTVGESIARRGWNMVFGGGHVGLMGRVSDAAMAQGAKVTGIITEKLQQVEVAHSGLSELHVVQTMHQRKKAMAEQADAFLVLPGGIGTFEEFFEVWTWRQLGYHNHPIGLLNVASYYDALLAFMHRTVEEGFLSPSQMTLVHVDTHVDALLDRLHEEALQTRANEDLSEA